MTRIKLPHIHRYMKGGRLYHYFRRGDQRVRLPGAPGSREFMDAYAAALEAKPAPIGASRLASGSMAALAASYYTSNSFTSLAVASQRTYRRLLDAFLVEHGANPVALLEPRHLLDILRDHAAKPAQANALRNVLRQVLQHGFEAGWRRDNPARDVRRLRYKKKPFPTWDEDDIAAYEAHWPSGSKPRLALALMLYTGQRRSDVIRMGPQHIRDGHLTVRQQKTGKELAIPLHANLSAELAQAPRGHLAYLLTEYGAPFSTGTGFYNWFAKRLREAGIKHGLSPHGLRKATSRRLAEARCTPHEIAAITGLSLKEVERYTRQADQKHLAASAVKHLGPRKKG